MYEPEILDPRDDCGVMPNNVAELSKQVVGHKIVSVEKVRVPSTYWRDSDAHVITLDNGKRVQLADSSDCCAYTELAGFFLDPSAVDHVITGVGTTDGYTTWHIFADFGDVLKLNVNWSAGNPFYYGYGFTITVLDEE